MEILHLSLSYEDISDDIYTLPMPTRLNNTQEYLKWRYLQTMHYLELWKYSVSRSEYYLQMEDDAIASKNYLKFITERIKKYGARGVPWFEISYCNLGYIGETKCSA